MAQQIETLKKITHEMQLPYLAHVNNTKAINETQNFLNALFELQQQWH